MPVTLVTWFHADDADRAGSYSQIRGSAASSAVHEIYLRCVDVCVASFRRWNPDGRALVVVNAAAEPSIGETRRMLWERLGVDVRTAENRHRPDVDLFEEWQNQFFLFDVLRIAAEQPGGDDDPIVVLDSDVLVQGPLAGLADRIAADGRVAMRIEYAEDDDANGSTRRDLRRYVEELSGSDPGFAPMYQGGEFVAATRQRLRELVAACQRVYDWTLERQAAGRDHPHEEAHMISVAAPQPAASAAGNAFIERIWTKPWNLRLVPAAAAALVLWHLPAEKRTGFVRLHRAAGAPRSWFWTASDDAWRLRAGRAVGVPAYGPIKLVRDVLELRGDVVPAVLERLRRR